MIQAYRLQLEGSCAPHRYIITGNEWFSAGLGGLFWEEKDEFFEETGDAIIYPEHNLLWIGFREEKTERFKTLENFEKEFNALPRWEATRYAVVETPNNFDDDGRVLTYALFLYDCRTGEQLIDRYGKPVAGREAEVARLRRGIEPMMRGEHFSFDFEPL
jgi:hypothetical protein